MPVQKTFTLIPAPRSRDVSPAIPTAGRPQIMTSKQVKAAHKAANKGPKLTKAEQRQLEKAEQARIRKEFEKEKAAAKARLLRDKKKDKEDAEKAEKRKKGLPTVKIRPSQGMIAGWVRGKKRDSDGSVKEKAATTKADETGKDQVLVAVMEEDERGSEEISPAIEEELDKVETATPPNRSPDNTRARDAESLPPDVLDGILSRREESEPSHEHHAPAPQSPGEHPHEGSHESSRDVKSTTVINQLPEGFDFDLDDLDPALLEDWKPSSEAEPRPPPTDPYAVDLGLSSPRRRNPSQERKLLSPGRFKQLRGSGGQHNNADQSFETGSDHLTPTNNHSTSKKKKKYIEQTNHQNCSQTGNEKGETNQALSQQSKQPGLHDLGRAPRTPDPVVLQSFNDSAITRHDATVVDILSGDFDLDDDLIEELAGKRCAGTSKPAVEKSGLIIPDEDAFGVRSQDFQDAVFLGEAQAPQQDAQLKASRSEVEQVICSTTKDQQGIASSDDFGDFDDDITLSQLPPITARPHVTPSQQTMTAARLPQPTTPVANDRGRLMDPPPLPRSVTSKMSNDSPAQQRPPPSTQAIMLNPEDFFPTSSQQALELEDDSPQLPERASQAIEKVVPAPPSFKIPTQQPPMKKQKPSPQQAPPPPSSPPPRFFTSSGSRSRHSLRMLQEKRAKDRAELRRMEEMRIEKGRVEAEQRRLERDKRRQEEERWKHDYEQKRRQEEAKKLQQQRKIERPSADFTGESDNSKRRTVPALPGKENVKPAGKVFGGIELDDGVITENMIGELVSASQESFGGDWVDDLEVDLTIP